MICGLILSYCVNSLTLQQAETLALNNSNLAKSAHLSSQSYKQLALAAGEFADPKLNFGLINLPTDDFSITKNPTTQMRVGIKQMLPRGSILSYKQAEKNNLSKVHQLNSELITLEAIKQTRLNYLDLYNGIRKKHILVKSRKNFSNLVKLTEQKFANGLTSQQAVINAKLQRINVDDKILQTQNSIELAQNRLSLLIGDAAFDEIKDDLPSLKIDKQWSKEQYSQEILPNQPAVQQATAMIARLEDKQSIRQELKKPAWIVGLEYRKRFGENSDFSSRSDMLALTASLDLPIFAEKKQNRLIAANQFKIEAAEEKRMAIKKKFIRDYQINTQQKKIIKQRLMLYQDSIQSKTYNNAQAALQAYRNGKSDFSTLIAAENLQLNTEIEILNLKISQLKNVTHLLYLTHEGGNNL